MIQGVGGGTYNVDIRTPLPAPSSGGFRSILQTAHSTDAGEIQVASRSVTPEQTPADTPDLSPEAQNQLGDPNVQQWLENLSRGSANKVSISPASYEAAPGAGSNYEHSYYGPDAIYNQAICNVVGNAFAAMTGDNPALMTGQLPGIPSQYVQNLYDSMLAAKNLQRLETGQPIDTSAYWSDPGPLTVGNKTYTSAELGYAGPGKSSGPQPIYLSVNSRINGTDNYMVPGYSGTVSGLQPGRYYTLQQLEAAGLTKGQEANQFTPGSWSGVSA